MGGGFVQQIVPGIRDFDGPAVAGVIRPRADGCRRRASIVDTVQYRGRHRRCRETLCGSLFRSAEQNDSGNVRDRRSIGGHRHHRGARTERMADQDERQVRVREAGQGPRVGGERLG